MSTAIAARSLEVKLLGNLTKKYEIPEALEILEGADQPAAGQMCMRVPTPKDGDKRLCWSRSSRREIYEAKKMFLQFIKDGLVPYFVAPTGKKSNKVMRKFDKNAEEVVFLPMGLVRGG